jgi:Xaa-Pro aminopeptidase
MEIEVRKEEQVAAHFVEAELIQCQKVAWEILNELSEFIKPGVKESQARDYYFEICNRRNILKHWHPPQIRFGESTVLPFGAKTEDKTLQQQDLFFLDIGPIVNGYEGDVGKTLSVGNNDELEKLALASREVFEGVKLHWAKHNISGNKLYLFASNLAQEKGYELALQGASGHRISDFPHAIHFRGKLKDVDFEIAANRWILEIHLINRRLNRGAFFEDML